jgi:REP element-mobilizing transposase RayT
MKWYAQEHDIMLDIINGVQDHVHCLMRLKTTQCVADVIGTIKGESSYWVNKNVILHDELFEWQDGYGVISISPEQINGVRKYIYNQEIHHQNTSIGDELKTLNFTKNINKPRPSGLS